MAARFAEVLAALRMRAGGAPLDVRCRGLDRDLLEAAVAVHSLEGEVQVSDGEGRWVREGDGGKGGLNITPRKEITGGAAEVHALPSPGTLPSHSLATLPPPGPGGRCPESRLFHVGGGWFAAHGGRCRAVGQPQGTVANIFLWTRLSRLFPLTPLPPPFTH